MIQCAASLSPGDVCASIVSSGDIDAVLLHLFAISHLWPRNEGGFFKNPVHVILKKPNHLYDIYNITTILELLEHKTSDKYIGIKVAVGLNLGGNDFLPKFYGVSHATKLYIFLKHEQIYNNLIHIITEKDKILSINFSSNAYKDFMKHVYCPICLIHLV